MLPTLLTLSILLLLVIAMVVAMRRYRQRTDGTADELERCTAGGSCCGGVNCHRKHTKVDTPTYFEDEELDRYRGKKATDYSPDEVAEWADVLTTLRPNEVAEWVTSIHRRQLHIPDALRENVTQRLKEA